MRREVVVPIVVGVATFIVGTGVGYVVAKRQGTRTEIKYITPEGGSDTPKDGESPFERREAEGQQILAFNSADPRPEAVPNYGHVFAVSEGNEVPEVVHVSELDDSGDILVDPRRGVWDDHWDYEVEMENRIGDRPYIIHYDEYAADENDWPHETLMYYVGDDVLMDEKEEPIYGYQKLVGILRFGHGSNDPNIVFVRNPARECEYEILRNDGHYMIEVHGAEIEHQRKRKGKQHPKFRLD